MSQEAVAFLASWSWEPLVVAGLVAAAALYAVGWRRLHVQARGKAVLASWRPWCYGLGLALIAIALLSPIAVFTPLFLFMHMVQHVLLIVAAPFLLLGSPLLPVLWALPRGLRRPVSLLFSPGSPLYGAFHVLTTPIVAALVYMAALGLWHVPSFYDAAQGRHLIHDLEHLTFLWASLLYWWPVVHPSGGRRRLGYGYAVFYLLVPMLEKHVIGMVLTFASQPLYDTYQQVPRVWGVSLLLDQQLAGATMWASGGIIHLVAIFVVLGLLFRQEEREARGRARFGASSATDRGQAVPESRGNGRGSRERPR